MANMANKKEQRFRKIRKGGIWGSFIALLVVTTLLNICIVICVSLFSYYLLRSNLLAEYEKAGSMTKLYDAGVSDEDMLSFLGGDGRVYLVKDGKGKILHSTGEDTISETGAKVLLHTEVYEAGKVPEDVDGDEVSTYSYSLTGDDRGDITVDADYESGLKMAASVRPVKDTEKDGEDAEDEDPEDTYEITTVTKSAWVYMDKKLPVLTPHEDNLSLNLKNIGMISDSFTDDFFSGKERAELPYWIAMETSEGNTLYCRSVLRFSVEDMAVVGIVFVLIAFLMIVAFIMMICSFVGGLRKQKKLTTLFFMDEVTGGKNWMWFLIRIGQFLRKRRNDKYNYAVMDLVFVNYRNYCMCHSIAKGEELLSKVDNKVRGMLDRKKEAIAHYASANFAVLFRYENKEQLEERLNGLISELEGIDKAHNFSFHIGVDLLYARTDKNGRFVRRKKDLDLEEEYNNACTARSTLADNDGSAIAFFEEELVREQKWLDTVQEEQRSAMANEEFLVYYQPKYNPVTNELSGAEALIRWDSPKYGFQNPGKFIPIFEKNGFITEIDHYMLEHVAKDQKRWLDEGKKCVPVSVNVSRAHFIENDLAEQIRDIVDAQKTPHELIEIELTESAFFDDKKAIIRTIGKLKEYGFTVSMDDFGSGYSSLNSLKDMPLDVLKLDAEFFRGENTGERGEIVVKEALKLAKALNMRTVAEGVEIKEQVDFLADQGCDMIQGYYFAKPMPASDYEGKMS